MADVDTEDNAADFALGDPTPGTASFAGPSAVPEPGSFLLLGMGLAALGVPRLGQFAPPRSPKVLGAARAREA
jgi:hypothetical protein